MSVGSDGYDLAAWHDFLITAAGAAAALSGLIFVSVSINLKDILAEEKKIGSSYLTGRALESLAALFVIPGLSMIGLDPSISRGAFAFLLLVSAVGSAVSPYRSVSAYLESHVKPGAYSLRLFLALTLVAGYGIAGVTLLTRAGGGLQ